MKERGMIFNGEMVRAIVDGRKTQTRRIVKPQRVGDGWSVKETQSPMTPRHTHDWWLPTATRPYSALPCCPYGVVGDRLRVRETFQWPLVSEDLFEEYQAYPEKFKSRNTANTPPSWASRITLEITSVRVERLNSINEESAQAEGVSRLRGGYWKHYQPGWTQHQLSARGSFVTLWKSIYGEKSWQTNPWVWVIEFKLISKEAQL